MAATAAAAAATLIAAAAGMCAQLQCVPDHTQWAADSQLWLYVAAQHAYFLLLHINCCYVIYGAAFRGLEWVYTAYGSLITG
jgi:hypothetical protein